MNKWPYLLWIFVIIGICASQQSSAESGGPDSFGYTFKDSNETGGPAYNWIDISSNGTSFNLTGDWVRGPYDIGFDFFFYGEWYNQWWLGGDNGYINLGTTDYTYQYSPRNIPTTQLGNAAIAPFWKDLRGCSGDNPTLSYKNFGSENNQTLVIQYNNLREYSHSCDDEEFGLYSFEIILFEKTGDIVFQYNNDFSNGESDNGISSIGIQVSSEMGLQYYYGGIMSLEDAQFSVRFYAPPIPQYDLLMSGLEYDSYFSLNYNETITAVIKNVGAENQTGFNLSFKISDEEGGVLYTHIKNVDFIERCGSTLKVKLVAPILMDFDVEINSNITIGVSLLISDENMSNNEINSETKIVYVFFKENFEEGIWENSDWDFSESQAWNYTTDAYGNRSMFSGYRCSQDRPALTSITSPSIDLSVGSNISLKFSHSYYFYYTYEGAFLEIDTGNGFTKINPEGAYVAAIHNGAYYGNPIRGSLAWTEYSNYGGYTASWVHGTSPNEVVFDLSSSVNANNNNDYSNVKLRWSVGLSSLECNHNGGYGFDNVVITGDVKPHDMAITNLESEDILPLSSFDYSKSIENGIDALVNNRNGSLTATLKNMGFTELNLDNVTFKFEVWKLDSDGVYFLDYESAIETTGILYSGEKTNVLINYNIDLGHQYQFSFFTDYELDMNEENNEISFDVLDSNLAYNGNDWEYWTSICGAGACSDTEIEYGSEWKLVNGYWLTGNDRLKSSYNGDDYSIISPTFDLSSASSNIYIVLEHSYSFAEYDGGRIEMCFETVTYCSIVTPTFSGYRGEVYNYAYYGNPLGGSEAFMGSSDSIGNTIAIIDKETIPGIHIHDVKFRFRMGGVYMETSSSWTIYNFSLYSSGKEIEGDKITIPESTFIADDFSIAVNYTNNGTEDIDFAYLQASMYNLQNGINLVSHKPITNLKMGDSVNVTFDYKADIDLFSYFESFSNMTIFEIEVKVLNRSSEYSNYIVDSCTVDEFTISPNRNYIYHPNDDMSFYCSDKMVPYDDLILDNNILKTEISLLNKPPTISLLEESETLLKNQNYTFVQYDGEINDELFVTSQDMDGYIIEYKWKTSLWANDYLVFTCWEDCATESLTSFGLTTASSYGTNLGLEPGFQTITIYAVDNYNTLSTDFVEFNVTILADTDRDGIPDIEDFFPTDGNEWVDSDGDGYGDNGDEFPNDIDEWFDSDLDGVGNNADACDYTDGSIDTDGDGYCEKDDACPNNANGWRDFDSDTVCDILDAFPLNGLEWEDTDGDGYGDNGDDFPNDINEWSDLDGDGVGDNSDAVPNNRFLNAPWQVGTLFFMLLIGFIAVNHGYVLFKRSSKVTDKLNQTKDLIDRLSKKGVKTDSLEKIVEEVEERMKEWMLK